MPVLGWVLLFLFIFLGLVGLAVPVLPGAGLIVVGAVIHHFLVPGYLTMGTLISIAALAFLTWGIDLLGGIVGAKWGGAGKWGLFGASIGAGIGLFFMPFGLLVGPLMGAFLGELLGAGRTLFQSIRAGFGAGAGTAVSILVRLLSGVLMVVIVVLDLIIN